MLGPTVYLDENSLVRVRCDAPGERAVSEPVGDGGQEDSLAFILRVAEVAGLEVDDSENADGLGPVTIGVPPGS